MYRSCGGRPKDFWVKRAAINKNSSSRMGYTSTSSLLPTYVSENLRRFWVQTPAQHHSVCKCYYNNFGTVGLLCAVVRLSLSLPKLTSWVRRESRVTTYCSKEVKSQREGKKMMRKMMSFASKSLKLQIPREKSLRSTTNSPIQKLLKDLLSSSSSSPKLEARKKF